MFCGLIRLTMLISNTHMYAKEQGYTHRITLVSPGQYCKRMLIYRPLNPTSHKDEHSLHLLIDADYQLILVALYALPLSKMYKFSG